MDNKKDRLLKLCKGFVEVRFENNIDLSENVSRLTTITKMLKKEFLQHNMDLENNILMLINPVKRYNCTIEPNRIVVDYDEPNSIGSFRVLALNALKEIGKILSIDSLARIGLRTLWGVEFEDLSQVNQIMRSNFIKISDEQVSKFGLNPDGFHWGFSATCGNYKVNYNFAPAAFQNINIQNNIITENRVANYALIDMDFYSDSKSAFSELNAFFSDSTSETEKQAKIFLGII